MKKKIIVITTIVIVTITSAILVYFLKFKDNDDNNEQYDAFINISRKTDDKNYLLYTKNYAYYLDGYLPSKIYVLRVDSIGDTPIDPAAIDVAKKELTKHSYSFNYNNAKYYMRSLKSDYVHNRLPEVDILEKNLDLIKEKREFKYGNIEIKKNDKKKDYTLFFSSENGYSNVYIKNLDITSIEINDTIYKDVQDILPLGYNGDIFIEHLENVYELEQTFGDVTGGENKFLNFNNDEFIITDRKLENDSINYYLSINTEKAFQEEYRKKFENENNAQ